MMTGKQSDRGTVSLRPTDDNVLVRLIESNTARPTGAVMWADVVATGPGRQLPNGGVAASNIPAGARVALRPGSALRLTVDGELLALVGARDVLGVLILADAGPRPVGTGAHEVPPIGWGRHSGPAMGERPTDPAIAAELTGREIAALGDMH